MTAESAEGSMNCTDMTLRLSDTQTGDQPVLLMWIVSSGATPIMRGILGPQISVSMMPMVLVWSEAKAWASMVVKVDLPTPPLPLRMRILWWMEERREVMRGRSGSGPWGVEAQMDWLGQPAQAEVVPAREDSGPGQCSGSGAMRGGWFLRGAERSIWMSEGGSMAVVVVVVDGMVVCGFCGVLCDWFGGVWCSLDGVPMIFLDE